VTGITRPHRLRLRARTVLTVAILAVVVAIAALAKAGPIEQLTADLGIQGKSEGFTSLYFQHPGYVGLPISTSATGPVRDRVAFAIQNLEHHPADYSWTIQLSPGGRRYTGSTHLRGGATASIVRTVTLPCGTGSAATAAGDRTHSGGTAARRAATVARSRRTRTSATEINVRVSLGWPYESIDFWQACNA
jgi:hypothetical protein